MQDLFFPIDNEALDTVMGFAPDVEPDIEILDVPVDRLAAHQILTTDEEYDELLDTPFEFWETRKTFADPICGCCGYRDCINS